MIRTEAQIGGARCVNFGSTPIAPVIGGCFDEKLDEDAKQLVKAIENGKAEPKLTTLQKIASVLEVPLAELVRQDSGSIEEELDLPLLEKVRCLG